MEKVKISDVAKYVGVSTATVSYVINGKKNRASKETIDKINEAIKRLNYIPDFSARSLAKNESKLIGVIIPQTEDYKQLLLQNPFYSELVSSIEYKCRENGYHIILSGVEKGRSYLDVSVQRNLDGAIIMGIYQEAFFEELKKVKIPIVLIDSYVNDESFYRIGIDDEQGGYLATRYLIECGHRNIALVTGSIKKDGVTEKRFLGYKRALKEANIFYNPNYVFENFVSHQCGYEAGRIIAGDYPEVTAVSATADLIALGVIKGIIEQGKRTPEDISVIGFDDISISGIFIPPLTTVRQDITMKGYKAVELLLRVLADRSECKENEILLPVEIIERKTVKRLS